jgi:hypothetical protein
MKRTGFVIVAGILFASVAAAQTQADAQTGAQTSVQAGNAQAQGSGSASAASAASTQNGQTNASLGSGAAINAELTAPVDSKKAKPGDPVAARTTEPAKSDGKTVIPKGSKLVGHVTQASARAKGDSESALGIVFDKAILKNGQEVPLNVAIQALASSQSAVAANAGEDRAAAGSAGAYAGGSGRAVGGALGGVTSTAGGAAGTVTNTAASAGNTAGGALNSTAHSATNVAGAGQGATGGLNATGQLMSNSRGVFGMQGVNLNSATAGAAEGSVITSAGKNLHLDSGTQMLLVTRAAGSAEAPKP